MKKSIYSFVVLLCLIFTYSCSENEDPIEFTEANELLEKETIEIKSIDRIDDLLFLNQYSKTEKYVQNLISDNFENIAKDYSVKDLTIDQQRIIVMKKGNASSYVVEVVIPKRDGAEEESMQSWVTFNFESGVNVHNQLQTAFGNSIVDFDSEGNAMQAKYGGGSSPWNKPSKAPKDVICRHASSLIGLNGYCGWSPGYCVNDQGQCPPPESMLGYINAWLADLTAGDMVIPVRNGMDPSRTSYDLDFDVFMGNPYGVHSVLKNEMEAFYYLNEPRYGGIFNYFGVDDFYDYNVSNQTEAWHIHKEAFVRSFQNWWFSLEDTVPNTFFLMRQNHNILRQAFMLFANLNLDSPMEDGVYMNIGGTIVFYSNIPNLTCMYNRAQFFYTPQAYTLLQQVDAGTMTWQQFEAQLPSCP